MKIYKSTKNIKLLKTKTMRKPNYNTIKMEVDAICFEGLSIERQIEIAETNKQAIEATSPTIYTARKDGVIPETNIRSDRFERAQELMDTAARATTAQRQDFIKSSDINPENKTAEA